MKDHSGDYGHGYCYEQAFCADSYDIEKAVVLCRAAGPSVLDLAGGAGRFAEQAVGQGLTVTLIDLSEQMLQGARQKRNRLSTVEKSRFSIQRQDIAQLDLPDRFDSVLSLNNGLEHLPSRGAIAETLRRVYRQLRKDGRLIVDVHNPAFWTERNQWKKGEWLFSHHFFWEEKKIFVWERTNKTPLAESTVNWEHALSHDFRHYTRLQTTIQLLGAEEWLVLFSANGFRVESCWGDWHENAVAANRLKLVFTLKKI